MDFSRYVPPEAIVVLGIIAVLVLAVGGFVLHDWVVPFVTAHVSLH